MRVPKEVRDVERPEKTIVYAYTDTLGNVRYGVKERTYWKENGKQYQKDGPTIGYIVNGTFEKVPEKTIPPMSYCESDIRTWGPYKLLDDLSQDIRQDLLQVYHRAEADRIYILAMLRAVEHELKDYEAKEAYENSFLSVMYPRVGMSKDTVGELLYQLGRTCSNITRFMMKRSAKVPENHLVAIDGMLKSFESDESVLSEFSRKALKKGTRDVNVIMAYDVDSMEPVCSNIYPGNINDKAVFGEFLKTNRISKGMIVTDKGFSYGSAKEVFLDNPGLHFLIPLNRDAKVIDEYRALCTDVTLSNRPAIAGRKVRMQDGRHLYAYRDPDIANTEEKAWLEEHHDYDPSELADMRQVFGSIVFISDLDAPLETMYAAYEERWELEVLFRSYKNILGMDEGRVKTDISLIGTEFVNFLSVIMLCRLRKTFLNNPDLSKQSFRSCMKVLCKGIMIRTEEGGEWRLMKLTGKQERIFIDIGLIEAPVVEKKRRGRPLGSKNKPKVQ